MLGFSQYTAFCGKKKNNYAIDSVYRSILNVILCVHSPCAFLIVFLRNKHMENIVKTKNMPKEILNILVSKYKSRKIADSVGVVAIP